uniref:Reverse transcriptase domain-containing protein n=1 Tax=Latimeria chalumnae TaxID=7897 RepID=H3A9V8_LATCH
GVSLCGKILNNLRFADDIDLIVTSKTDLQRLTDKMYVKSRKFGLQINIKKTKVMSFGKHQEDLEVGKFAYLGGLVLENGSCEEDIKRRIGLASAAFGRLSRIWKVKNILVKMKVRVYEAMVIPILLYGSEYWSMRKVDEQKILTTEMSWLRGILGVSRMQRIKNDIRRILLGQETTLIQKIPERRLRWFGHVSRMETARIPFMALHTEAHGTRSRGRPRKCWIGNVKSDLSQKGIQMTEAARLVQNQQHSSIQVTRAHSI